VSFNRNLQSRFHWSLFNGVWQKRNRELDHRLGFQIEEMTLQMQGAVYTIQSIYNTIYIQYNLYTIQSIYNTIYIQYNLFTIQSIYNTIYIQYNLYTTIYVT